MVFFFVSENERFELLEFLKKHEKERQHPRTKMFIAPPEVKIPYDTTDITLRNCYRYTPHELIEPIVLEKVGITTGDMKLHKFMAGISNNFISALYAVPVARKYFGDDFLHGVRCCAANGPRVVFRNMDDTTAATILTKEVTKYCAIVLDDWLKKYDYYLRWDYVMFGAVKPPIDYRLFIDSEYRIVWYEHKDQSYPN